MEVNVYFAKVKPNAIIPSKRDEDMGFDIYACFDEDYIVINPHETKLVPTGLASACDPGYGFVVFERGSTGSKGIARRCGVIDSGYRNEWFIGLTNTTNQKLFISKLNTDELIEALVIDKDNPIDWNLADDEVLNSIVYPYSKAIAQVLVVPVPKTNRQEISYEDLKAIPSERGLGALGSSGK